MARRRLADLAERRCFRLPLERVRDLEQRLDDWGERLAARLRQRLASAGSGWRPGGAPGNAQPLERAGAGL